MPINKKTKILATLGPASASKDILREMMIAGVDVFRINFSHADYEDVKQRINYIRELNDELQRHTAILADLQGPKLRVGKMEDGVMLNPGDQITFVTGESFVGNKDKVYMNYAHFPKDVNSGEKILLDDGKLIFEVLESNRSNEVSTKVIQGGVLKSNKGVNLPNTAISLPALTEKDIEDAIFAIGQNVDWIALSFVRHAKDIDDLRQLIEEHTADRIPIISKVEKPEAITNMKEIVMNSDAIMVARGDLGVEVPAEEVPLLQKQLVKMSKAYNKPVVIATQMMETMMDSLTPTRAEVNDVGNSVMDGADAVMLSGETSVGQYPVEVVAKMASIIKAVEESPMISVPDSMQVDQKDRFITNKICQQASEIANDLGAKVIFTLTNSGYTAFQISARRPNSYILVFTDNKTILGRLNLLWGVYACYYDKMVSTDETVEDVIQYAKDNQMLKAGDMTVSLLSMPIKARGMVNTLRVTSCE